MSNKQRPVLKLNKPATPPAPARNKPARPAAGKGAPYQGNKPKEGAAPRAEGAQTPYRTDAARPAATGGAPYKTERSRDARPTAPYRTERTERTDRPARGDAASQAPYRAERAPRSDDATGQTPYRSERPPRDEDSKTPFRTERFARRDDAAGSTPYRTGPKSSQPRTPAPAAAPVIRSEFNEDGLRSSYHRDFKTALQTSYQADVKPDSLAFALLGAAAAVVRVREGMALPQALAAVFADTQATPQARGAIQDVAYRAMRKLGWSDALVGIMAPKAPDPMVGALLACALPLMVNDDDGNAAYSQFTVVDQTVTAAAAHPDTARAKSMMNAVLRRFQRERQQLLDALDGNAVAQWNYPQWWIDAAISAYPQDWQAVLATGNQPPPLTLRVNARRATAAEYLNTLEQAGIAATQVGPYAVRLAKPVGVHQIPGFDDGVVSVQDAGAQLAATLLDVQDGMRVLDACAAPGGKTCHILELADCAMTALDVDARRLDRVGENLQRLNLQAELKPAEAQQAGWWDGQSYDRIVADVPCTASGIVRRHPDIRWLRRKSDALQLATLSSEILDNLWKMLAPNGKLLFVTCSVWPQESEAQAAAFAVRNGATRLDAPGQLLPTSSVEQDHDGLFYALFQKDA